MNLLLKRSTINSSGAFSQLTGEDADVVLLLQTIEHAYAQSDGFYAPKLPVGIYTCQRGLHSLDHSPKPFTTFEVLNVPGHTGILFHVGNTQADSAGCILLGIELRAQELFESRIAFEAFMSAQAGVESFQLTVES